MLTGSVIIIDNASNSPQVIGLTGTGINAVVPPALTVLGPAPRIQHSAALDATTGTMFIFGGQDPEVGDFNDVWRLVIYEGAAVDWKPVSPSGTPPAARYGHTGVYDSTNSRIMVFGGAEGLTTPAPCQNDTWVLQNANGIGGTPAWTQLATSGGPPAARFSHSSVYDSNTNSLIVFGGSDCASGLFNDVWVLSNANGLGGTPTWQQLSPAGSAPAGRELATSVYDQPDNLLIVFGGSSGATVNGDVWVLSNANGTGGTPSWTQLFPAGRAPAAREAHSAIYDAVSGHMVIFGGADSKGSILADTWILAGANGSAPTWTLLSVTGGVAKAYHSAVYNSATNEMIVWGGRLSFVPTDDHTFVLSEANGVP
jgi:hypothetical protein